MSSFFNFYGNVELSDAAAQFHDDADPSKKARLDCGAISPNTVRRLIIPDADVDLGLLSAPSMGDLTDVELPPVITDGYILKWSAAAQKWQVGPDTGGAGSTTFLALTDTPADYTGASGSLAKVKSTEDGLEFISQGPGGGLNADTVDGQHAADFAAAGHLHDLRYALLDHTHLGEELVPVDRTGTGAPIVLNFATELDQIVLVDQNVTIPSGWPVGEITRLRNTSASIIAATVSGGTIEGLSSIQIAPYGVIEFWCEVNTGSNPECYAAGELIKSTVQYATHNADGQQITNAVMPLADVQATSSFTLALTHGRQALIRCNHATVGIAVTVPPNASVAFPVGSTLQFARWGAAAVTFVAGAGVTINKPSSRALAIGEQYGVAGLWKQAADTWLLYGNLGSA